MFFQEICEFKKLLKYFNDELGPAVCIYTVVNLSWAAAGTVWLFEYDKGQAQSNPVTWIGIINVGLWVLISVAPFIQVRSSIVCNPCLRR